MKTKQMAIYFALGLASTVAASLIIAKIHKKKNPSTEALKG